MKVYELRALLTNLEDDMLVVLDAPCGAAPVKTLTVEVFLQSSPWSGNVIPPEKTNNIPNAVVFRPVLLTGLTDC